MAKVGVAYELTMGIDKGGLDLGPAEVDGQGDGSSRTILHDPVPTGHLRSGVFQPGADLQRHDGTELG